MARKQQTARTSIKGAVRGKKSQVARSNVKIRPTPRREAPKERTISTSDWVVVPRKRQVARSNTKGPVRGPKSQVARTSLPRSCKVQLNDNISVAGLNIAGTNETVG